MNRLNSLPRGFGAFPVLEVLDLTYNNLDENSLPGNFFKLGELISLFAIKFTLKTFVLCYEVGLLTSYTLCSCVA